MNQAEVLDVLSRETGLTRSVLRNVFKAQEKLAVEELKSAGSFNTITFGKVVAKTTAERRGRNPKTGEDIKILPKTRITLKVSKPFKVQVG